MMLCALKLKVSVIFEFANGILTTWATIVLEHMENPYDLLRDMKFKSRYKIIHFPLDISVKSVLRDQIVTYREQYGHIHYFTKSIALRMLEEMGYEVLDCFYTYAA